MVNQSSTKESRILNGENTFSLAIDIGQVG